MIDSIKQLLQQEAQAVLNIPVTDAYEKAVQLIVEQIHQKKGKLVTSGMGKAGQIARTLLPLSVLRVSPLYFCTLAKHYMVTWVSCRKMICSCLSPTPARRVKSSNLPNLLTIWTRN